jgi:tetratricopeptide (TPR) repeat protein
MNIPRESLILALVLLAVPAFAAKSLHVAAKPSTAVPAPVSADPAGDLIDQAQAAQSKGDKDLAIRLAQAAIVADPARPATYVALGEIYAAAGEADYARFYFNEALTIDPADANATRAVAALDHGDNQRAAQADTPNK